LEKNRKIKKWGVNILKLGFGLLILYLIFTTIDNKNIRSDITNSITKFTIVSYGLIIIVTLLQFINWTIEALKFKYILKRKKITISNKEAIASIYLGNATGIVTPDRLGNFIGRFLYLQKINKTLVTSATTLGNYAQLVSTITFALLSATLLSQLETKIKLSLVSSEVLLIFTFIIWVASVIILFYPKILVKQILKFKWFEKRKADIEYLNELTKKECLIILIFGLLRYIIFIVQFYIVLNVFGISIILIDTLIFSGILYLLTTLVPSPFLGNLGTREYFSILLLSNFHKSGLVIIASLSIWVINIAIPALIGTIILLGIKNEQEL